MLVLLYFQWAPFYVAGIAACSRRLQGNQRLLLVAVCAMSYILLFGPSVCVCVSCRDCGCWRVAGLLLLDAEPMVL